MKNKITLKITITAILTALSLISFMLESLFPPLFIPGAKMGVSNVFILLAVFTCGYQYAFIGLLIKILLGSLFSGNFSMIMYSLPAGIISISLEMLLIHFNKFSILSISVVGSVISLSVQNTVYCLITRTFEFFIYLPYLALIGVLSGAIIGLIVFVLMRYLPKKFFIRNLDA
jgi:heptaprenyl diphosphate synthase